MVMILLCVVLAAWIAILLSQQRIREQEEKIGRLTRRIWALEQRGEAEVKPPEPAPAAVVEPRAEQPRMPLPPPIPRTTRSSVEWEALIGGNILNKLGALLLVIGVMSFLGYYGTHMSPAGRAGCAVVVSLALLGSGIRLERREAYRMFARGLIGAGWAALYATAYALYALPAARIIDNPLFGSMLVLLVAAGMITHSLRYRAQGVTAVAFFSAFAALAVTPSTLFAVLALIPLAAAVLYLAQRFNWHHMALMGVLATYGACGWRGESPGLLVAFWVLFELFDLLRFSRRVQGWAVELIFPLNAAGFLGFSYHDWAARSPAPVWMLSGCAALLYGVSALWRVKIEADRGFDPAADLPARIRSGSYEAPLAVGAFLIAAAIVQKLTGTWISTALAMEAEALFIAGIVFRSRWVRGLAAVGFLASLGNLATLVLFVPTQTWVALALFHALLFYVNRALSKRDSLIGAGFSWAASLLVMLAAWWELPDHFIGTAWLVMAAILFEFGIRKRLREFRWQAYAVAVCGGLATLFRHQEPAGLAIAAAIAYLGAWRSGMCEKAEPGGWEWRIAGWFTCGATALFGSMLIYRQAPYEYAGAFLWGFALVLLELGFRRLPERLRPFSYAVAAAATVAVIDRAVAAENFAAAAAAFIMSVRERNEARNVFSLAGLVFALRAWWLVMPEAFVPAVWGATAFAVLELGNALHVQAYRRQAEAAAGIAALSAFLFTLPDGHAHRIVATALLIAVHIGFRIRAMAAAAPYHIGVLALLAAALLYQEVSGSLLTIAWGAEALVLLATGFAFRDRFARLAGLAVFLVCVLKLFFYDLRNLDTPYRILSFIALGLILLGVSWIYTRFRAQLQKLL